MFSILEAAKGVKTEKKKKATTNKKINHRQNSELLYNTSIYIEGTLKVQKE